MASRNTTATAPAFDPSKVREVKIVSLPTLSVSVEHPIYVRFETAIGKRKVNEGTDNEREFQFARVIDLTTGELMNLNIDNGILWALEGNYEGTDYVGKSFAITGFKEPGRRFMRFKVAEIEY